MNYEQSTSPLGRGVPLLAGRGGFAVINVEQDVQNTPALNLLFPSPGRGGFAVINVEQDVQNTPALNLLFPSRDGVGLQ